MSIDLKALKQRNKNGLAKLQKKLEENTSSGFTRDERLYKPKFNQEKGKGSVILRFLPPKDMDCDPIIEVKSHQFKGKNGFYWNNSLASLRDEDGKEMSDPVKIACINAWVKRKATSDERYRDIAMNFMEKRTYYANVLIIKDEEQPDLEGKVMIYQFGPQIMDIINGAIKPEFEDENPIDPFDLWDGADFIIKMVGRQIPDRKSGKQVMVPNYEKSVFAAPSEFMEGNDEAKIEYVQKTYLINEFIAPDKFKSFDQLAEQFKKVYGQPYNWLSDDYAETKAKEIDHAAKEPEPEPFMKEEKESGSEMPPWGDDDSTMDVPEKESSEEEREETPAEKFRRLSRS